MQASAVVFDAYGTLFDLGLLRSRCEALSPDRGAQLAERWRQKQLEYTWLRSCMGRYVPFSQVTRDALAFACASVDLRVEGPTIAELCAAYLELPLFGDARGALEALKSGGCRLAILSNGSRDMIEPLVQQSGLSRVLDCVLTSDMATNFKPSPAVYRLATEAFSLPARQILFVSANAWDAAGAKSFGFVTRWINRQTAPPEALGLDADRVLRSLGELNQDAAG